MLIVYSKYKFQEMQETKIGNGRKTVHLRNLTAFYQDKMKYDLCISDF